jgi:hypothetical protein|tara:strand:- start:18 stop:119 length:102 start_codon:yes stop_codon:yes gene_type:complete
MEITNEFEEIVDGKKIIITEFDNGEIIITEEDI